MDHSYFIDRLSAYHDRDLPAQELQIVEEHVQSCPDCQEQLVRFKRLDTLAKTHAALDDTAYWEQLARRTEQRLGFSADQVAPVMVKRTRFTPVWRYAAVAASVVLIGFIGMHYSDILKPMEQQGEKKSEAVTLGIPGVDTSIDRADKPHPETAARRQLPETTRRFAPPLESPTVVPKAQQEIKPKLAQPKSTETESDRAASTGVVEEPVESREADEISVATGDSASYLPITDGSVQMIDNARELPNPSATALREEAPDSIALQLSQLRATRDSLTTVLTVLEEREKNFRLSPTLVPKTAYSSLAKTGQPPDSVRVLLLDIHAGLARLSPDTAEKRQSLDYLKSVTVGKDTNLARRADSLLALLKLANPR